ncbi:hypothetical protein ABZY81_25780 [Streptomyces sp. NPDC006514]|uniref:hypothetical protein n=1 Tax=Streptomyces sp. NPDC006514 TaxID=3154308 RepID=UPI0033AE3324
MTWRLVGANNHELGRSPHVHSSLTACCSAVQRLRTEAARASALVAMSPGTGSGTPGTGPTLAMFSAPSDQRTADYVEGRFG